MSKPDGGGPAFPVREGAALKFGDERGMSLHDYFMGQALANHAICNGVAASWELTEWFGSRGGIRREEIAAKQAAAYADAMLQERAK